MIKNALLLSLVLAIASLVSGKLRTPFNPREDIFYIEELKKLAQNSQNVETIYYALEGLALLGAQGKPNCEIKGEPLSVELNLVKPMLNKKYCGKKTAEDEQEIATALKKASNLRDLFTVMLAAKDFGLSLDKNTILEKTSIFHDKTIAISNGYAYAIFHLLEDKEEMKKLQPTVRTTISSLLHLDAETALFENGAYNTAFIIQSILNLEKALGQTKSEIPAEIAQKLIMYFYSQRSAVADPKSWFISVTVLKNLLSAQNSIPMVLFNLSPDAKNKLQPIIVQLAADSTVNLGYMSIWPAIRDPKVKIDFKVASINDKLSKKSVMTPKNLICKATSKPGECQMKLTVADLPAKPGAYDLVLVPVKENAELTLVAKELQIPLVLKAAKPINVKSVVLKISPSNEELKLTSVNKKHDRVLKLSEDSNLSVKVDVDKPVEQISVRFSNSFDGIAYSLNYKFDADSHQLAIPAKILIKDSLGLGGRFTLELIVADAGADKSIKWPLADVEVPTLIVPGLADSRKSEFLQRHSLPGQDLTDAQFSVTLATETGAGKILATLPFAQGELSNQRRPLEHTFRKPDPRANSFVALLFTVVCLSPFVLMLITWLVVGINLKDLPCSISVPIFHLGLLGIFVIYTFYWLRWNIFMTVRYAALVGIPTFLAGNSLLRKMVNRRASTTSNTCGSSQAS